MSYSVYIKEKTISFGTDTDGETVSYNLFFSGCSKDPKCKGCHNATLWKLDPTCGKDIKEWITEIDFVARELIEALVFLGGEPMDQPVAVYDLAKHARDIGMYTWLYTGREYSEVPEKIINVMSVIVAGPYVEEKATGNFPASNNQQIYRE